MFEIIMLSLLIFLGLLALLFLYLGQVRNTEVCKHLKSLVKEVSERARKDIAEGKDYEWRYELMDQIVEKYSKMVWLFWRKLDSFYDKDKLLK